MSSLAKAEGHTRNAPSCRSFHFLISERDHLTAHTLGGVLSYTVRKEKTCDAKVIGGVHRGLKVGPDSAGSMNADSYLLRVHATPIVLGGDSDDGCTRW